MDADHCDSSQRSRTTFQMNSAVVISPGRALPNTTGSSRVALRAAVTQQQYYTCASRRTAETILLAHLNTVAVIQFSALLTLIVAQIY